MGPGQSTDVRADRSDGQGPGHSALPSGRPLGHMAPCAGVWLWPPRPLLHQTPPRTEPTGLAGWGEGGRRPRASGQGPGEGGRPTPSGN